MHIHIFFSSKYWKLFTMSQRRQTSSRQTLVEPMRIQRLNHYKIFSLKWLGCNPLETPDRRFLTQTKRHRMYDVSFATLDLKCPRSTRQLWEGWARKTNKQTKHAKILQVICRSRTNQFRPLESNFSLDQ